MSSATLVSKFIAKEIPNWNDNILATARFKAFSGQRSDWEPKFQNEGDTVQSADLVDPTSGRLSQLFMKVRNLMARSTISPEVLLRDRVVFTSFAKGLKVSLSETAVSVISNLDCDILLLIWTMEKLQQQLDVTDRHYEIKSRKSALTSLQSGNKRIALRYAKQLKLAKENREKCISLLNRVEEVLSVIKSAESTKKVSEAIQIGAQAIKKNKISVEEVQLCLEDFEESIDLQKQVEKVLGVGDEDIEEEFKDLESEFKTEDHQVMTPKTEVNEASEVVALESSESVGVSFSSLRLEDGPATASAIQDSTAPVRNNKSNRHIPEPAWFDQKKEKYGYGWRFPS